LGSHPALAGWYTADERPSDQAERVFHQYKILREYDPDGVTFIAQNKLRELSWWRDAADVIDAHRYPIYNIPEGRLSPLEWVLGSTDAAQDAVERSRPVWSVIQYFPHGRKGHWPTYDELRTMSYMAIIAGAKGLFYWSYGAKGLAWVKDDEAREALWQRLVKVTKEIKTLEPALLSRDAPEILTNRTVVEGIRFLAKKVDNTRYIFAVNSSPEERQATFVLHDRAKTATVIGEGRAISLQAGNSFTEHFAPYAAHVYKISGPLE
jgi:hypothetical protein